MGGMPLKRWVLGIGLLILGGFMISAAPLLAPSLVGDQTESTFDSPTQPGTLGTEQSLPKVAQAQTSAPTDLVEKRLFKPMDNVVLGKTTRGQTILDAPPFSVISRKEEFELYPCSECHEDEEPNPLERELEDEHEDLVLEHGGGRFWCLTCHLEKNRDQLTSLNDTPIDFDTSFLLCGQCHFEQQKDWYFGGHGKRIGTWKGPRVIRSCPECHDPHSPSIKPFTPKPPPKVRTGLIHTITPPERHYEGWELKMSDKGGRHE